jgi:hypothetical protein
MPGIRAKEKDMGGPPRDDREHPRVVTDALVEVVTAGGPLLAGRTRNLSRGGLCVELTGPVEPGAEVEIRITLVFHDDHRSETLGLTARVVWCTPLGDCYQVGSQFGRLSFDEAVYLNMFLSYMDASPRLAEHG